MGSLLDDTRTERSSFRRSIASLLLASLLALFILIAPQAARATPGEVEHFTLPAGSEPEGIAAGADGNLWFAERGSDQIGRISPSGRVTEYPLPTPASQPSQMTAGPDGNVWFTESGPGNIGRITPSGVVTEFPVCDYCRPWGISAGPEGDVWFTLPVPGEVGRISPSGQVTRFPLAIGANEPALIAVGSDGNLWIADKGLVEEEPTVGQIVRLTPTGRATSFKVPTPVENFRPTAIAAGPDGALWFAGSGTGVGRIDTAGSITEFPLPLFGERDTIVAGPDGNIWLSNSGPEAADGSIDRLTLDGHLTTYPVPYGSRGVTVGPDGNIWFTEWAEHGIGRIVPGSPGIEIRSSRVALRGRRTRVSLACSGGTPGAACGGTVLLRARLWRRSATATVRFGSGPYRLANGRGASFDLRLNRRTLRWLARHRVLRVEAVARASRGEGSSRTLELARPFQR